MPFTVINTPQSGSNLAVANSSAQVALTPTGTAQQTTDTFVIPASSLLRAGSGWKFTYYGVISQGATVETVTYSSGGSPLGAAFLPAAIIPSTLMAASTVYGIVITWEWTCLSVTGGNAIGYASYTASLAVAGPTMSAPTGSLIQEGNWNIAFGEPLGGANVQPYAFYAAVEAAAGGGTVLYQNNSRFEWYPGPS